MNKVTYILQGLKGMRMIVVPFTYKPKPRMLLLMFVFTPSPMSFIGKVGTMLNITTNKDLGVGSG